MVYERAEQREGVSAAAAPQKQRGQQHTGREGPASAAGGPQNT